MNVLPKDILKLVSRCDYALMRHLHPHYPITRAECTSQFADNCAKHNDVRILDHILSHNTHPFALIEDIFETAVVHHATSIVRYLYKKYESEWDKDCICEYVIYCVSIKYLDIVYFFIDETNIDLEYNNNKILETATETRNERLVNHILNNPRLDDLGENEILLKLIQMRDYPMLRLMLNHPKVNAHEPDNEPMRLAIFLQDEWIVNKLWEDEWVVRTFVFHD